MEEVYEEVHNNSEDATAGRRRRKRRTKRAKDKKRAKSKRRPRRRRRRTKRAAAQPTMYQHPQPTVYQHPIGASAYATNPLAPTAQPAKAARWDVKTGKDMNNRIDPDKDPEKPMTQSQSADGLASTR